MDLISMIGSVAGAITVIAFFLSIEEGMEDEIHQRHFFGNVLDFLCHCFSARALHFQ
jgi:hypothetical protein